MRWNLPDISPEQIENLAVDSGLSWALCAVLASRGVKSQSEARTFINGPDMLEDPFVLKDMDKAVARLRQAIEDGEKVAVYGDYDCDGITATALLISYLQSVGADVIYYVPSREKEGYGLNMPAIKMLSGQDVDLIVTVDNGVSAHEEINYANSLGIDVIITDHHTPRDILPDAVAVVNPHRKDCPCAFHELAGVGVAFKLICALENAHPFELLEYYSDLVALGTIADVVPLTGENRGIVKHGLERLRDNERPGIEALLNVSGLANRELSCESVAFGIIPRINAAGRMGVVDDMIELLLTDDSGYAGEVAELVNEQNVQRKNTEAQIMLEIDAILQENPQILLKRALVIRGENWHHGVVGIVASKVVEKYGKPCIIISIDGDVARGSGRSIGGFSLIEAITACSKPLTQFGGHTLAVGLTLPTAGIEAFDEALQAFAHVNYPRMPVACLRIDCVLPPDCLTIESIASLSALEPCGSANETPLFLLKQLSIGGVYPTADKKHIRIRFSSGGEQYYAVYFGMTEREFPYRAGDIVDIVAGITVGEYNGKKQLSIKIRDLRPSDVPQERILAGTEAYSRYLRGEYLEADDLTSLLADRDDLAVVYRFLRKCGGYAYGAASLYYKLMGDGVDFCRMLVALDIMEELGLISRSGDKISLIPDPPKVNLENSLILSYLKSEMRVMQGG